MVAIRLNQFYLCRWNLHDAWLAFTDLLSSFPRSSAKRGALTRSFSAGNSHARLKVSTMDVLAPLQSSLLLQRHCFDLLDNPTR
jgi:hypothetical protein